MRVSGTNVSTHSSVPHIFRPSHEGWHAFRTASQAFLGGAGASIRVTRVHGKLADLRGAVETGECVRSRAFAGNVYGLTLAQKCLLSDTEICFTTAFPQRGRPKPNPTSNHCGCANVWDTNWMCLLACRRCACVCVRACMNNTHTPAMPNTSRFPLLCVRAGACGKGAPQIHPAGDFWPEKGRLLGACENTPNEQGVQMGACGRMIASERERECTERRTSKVCFIVHIIFLRHVARHTRARRSCQQRRKRLTNLWGKCNFGR